MYRELKGSTEKELEAEKVYHVSLIQLPHGIAVLTENVKNRGGKLESSITKTIYEDDGDTVYVVETDLDDTDITYIE